jgi:hypothetical protein
MKFLAAYGIDTASVLANARRERERERERETITKVWEKEDMNTKLPKDGQRSKREKKAVSFSFIFHL